MSYYYPYYSRPYYYSSPYYASPYYYDSCYDPCYYPRYDPYYYPRYSPYYYPTRYVTAAPVPEPQYERVVKTVPVEHKYTTYRTEVEWRKIGEKADEPADEKPAEKE